MAETEAVLLRRFTRSGDAAAFAEIIRRHAGVVYGAAWRILADVDRASDVAQETFLQLTKDAAQVTGSLPGWLHRVATRKAIDRMRRDVSRRQREMKYATQRPREVAQWREISPYVDEGLNELDPEIRDILVLHFLQGRTTREIAYVRAMSQATVSRRIEAGVEQLRLKLRRRGIIVAVGALSALLGDNTVKAAPPMLLAELGKMALVGSAAGAVPATSGLAAAAGTVAAAVKTHAVAVAAVVLIGAGAMVTYQQTRKTEGTGPGAVDAEHRARYAGPGAREAGQEPLASSAVGPRIAGRMPATRLQVVPEADVPIGAGARAQDAGQRPADELSRPEAATPVGSVPVRAARSTGIPSASLGAGLPVVLNHGRDGDPACSTSRLGTHAHATGTPYGVTTSRVPLDGCPRPPTGQATAGCYYAAGVDDTGPDRADPNNRDPNDPNDSTDPNEP